MELICENVMRSSYGHATYSSGVKVGHCCQITCANVRLSIFTILVVPLLLELGFQLTPRINLLNQESVIIPWYLVSGKAVPRLHSHSTTSNLSAHYFYNIKLYLGS